MKGNVYIYTDGGCHGNPGPGGWAWRIVGSDNHVNEERSGYDPETTNNRMELTAVIDSLSRVLERKKSEADELSGTVVVVTDSQYVRQGITDWINRWRQNGWRTTAKKPVKNSDLWKQLDKLNGEVLPEWRWVKGHAGDEHNEACDQLVQEAIASEGH